MKQSLFESDQMLPTAYYLLLATYCLLPTTCYLLGELSLLESDHRRYLLLTTYYLLPTAYYLLLATY